MTNIDDTFDQFEEEEAEIPLGATLSGRKRLFSKELRCMMFGFGDDQNPYTESVDLLEDLVIEFITEMTHKAMEIGRTGRVQVEDIVFLVRKDQRKYARVKDLLTMNEELKKARKAFDEVKYAGQLLHLLPAYQQPKSCVLNITRRQLIWDVISETCLYIIHRSRPPPVGFCSKEVMFRSCATFVKSLQPVSASLVPALKDWL